MEESRPPTTASNNPSGGGCISFVASIEENLRYFKASVVGLTKKLTAKTEKEATDADLQTAKMQFEKLPSYH
ncbi:hypothetical protein BUALT_Bualt14G0038300 [Buddleja alternifolia]|uniref:Uncharacterized protein n=1 Tax=Buddleja alternifolia TaxID=168488 RepID=A0AAV6WG08_9LAMI|nr:hypothetical protein BUALT_Bualt14G0038300 [Buddleja alternifolia]